MRDYLLLDINEKRIEIIGYTTDIRIIAAKTPTPVLKDISILDISRVIDGIDRFYS